MRKSQQCAAAHLAGARVVLDLEAVRKARGVVGSTAGSAAEQLELAEGPVLEF